jgi:Protein of unknown function (DUF3467)
MNKDTKNNNPANQAGGQIKIADNIPGAEYANLMQSGYNKDEFQIMFASMMGGSGKVVGKIITSPGHFKRMLGAMQESLKKYEEQFGKIEQSESPGKSIGFK